MATKIIADLCINCDQCRTVCPNEAITDGSDVDVNGYYIHPNKCTECVGETDFEQCHAVCPVEGCIIPDPDIIEEESVLMQRALDLHPNDQDLKNRFASGNFPSLKKKLNIVP